MGYKVQPGDSWESIAGKVYGDQRMFAALANLNGWVMLQPGMEIELAEPQSDPYVGQSDIENANRLASYYGTEPYATYDELMTGGGAALPAVPTIPGVTEGETAPGGELFQTPGAVAPGAEPLMPAENLGVAGAGAGNVLPARPLSTAVTEELGTAGGTQAGQQLVSQALSTPPTTDPWARVEELRAAKAIPSEPAVTGGKVEPSLVPEGPTEPTLLPGISPYKPAPINKGPLDSLKNFTQSLVQDARRAWEQLAAETSSKYNDVPSTVGLAPEIPSWEGLNWFTALDLALPPIGAAVRLSRVWGQLENPVADILSGKFKEVLEADLQANPNIAPLLRNTITGAWSWLEGQEESKDLRASDLSRVSRGIATAIEVVGKMFSQGAIGLERLAGTIAIGLRENLPIKFEAHKIVEEWRFSPWYIDIAAQESANITINEAWQASRIMYSSIFDEAPVHEFIRELQAGEDPLLLQRKYMNPMAEMVGQTIFDPGWVFDIYNVGRVTRWVNKNLPVINIPLIGKRQLAHGTRLDRAADASRAYVLLDPNSVVTKGRQIFLDPNQAAKAGDGLMMMVNGMADAAKKHAQDLVTYVRKRGLFDIQAGGRAFDLWTEATETLMHLARNSSPEDFLRNLTAYISMTVDGSTVQQRADAIKLLLPNLMFSHLASDQGIRTGQVLADMFLDSAGKLDPTNIKWLLDQVIEVKKLPTKGEQIAELMKRLGPRVEASTIRINPDIVQRVKIQDEIAKLKAAGTWDNAPTWMKRFEGDKIPGWLRQLSTFDYYARKMVYGPVNNALSHVFMGLSLPYGIRNYQQDSFLIFVDRPSAFFASRRNMEALTKGILGALPEKAAQQFGGAVAALTTKTGTKKLFGYAIAGWAEAKSSMKIFGRTLEEVMIGAHEASAKTTRSLLQGRFTEAEIDTIVALQRKHQFDPYEAIKAFAGPEQTRRILVADPGRLRQLDAFPGLRDALQSALDDATDALDFERRSQLELAKQERLADAVSGEEVVIPPESNLGQELAKAGEHGTGWSVDLLARRNIAAEVAMEYQRQGLNKFCDAIAEATKGLPEGPQIEAALSKIQADTTTRVALAGADETRAANLLVEEVKKRYDAAQQSGASRDVLNGIWEEWRRLEGSRDTLHVEWRTRRLEIMQNGIVAAAKVHPEGQRILSAGFGPLDTANIVLETVLQMDDCDPILFAMTGRMYRTATGRPALDLMDEFGMPYTTRGGKPRPRPDGSLAPGAQPGILLQKEGLATSVNKYLPEDGSIRPFTPSELLSKDPAVWPPERLAELRTVLQRRNAVRGKTIAESVDEAAQFAEEGRKTEEFITSAVAANGLDDLASADTADNLLIAADEAGFAVRDASASTVEGWKKETGGQGAWAEFVPGRPLPPLPNTLDGMTKRWQELAETVKRGGLSENDLDMALAEMNELSDRVDATREWQRIADDIADGTISGADSVDAATTRMNEIADRLAQPPDVTGSYTRINPALRDEPIETIRAVLTHELGEKFVNEIHTATGANWLDSQNRLSKIVKRLSGGSDLALSETEWEKVADTIADGIAEYFGPNRRLLEAGKSEASAALKALSPADQKALYQYVAKEVATNPEFAAWGGALSGTAKPVVMGPDGVPLTPERPIVGPDTGPAPSGARAVAENETGMRALVNSIIDDQKKIWDQRATAAVAVTPERRQALQQWAKVTARNMEEAKVVATTVAGRARDWALHSYPSKRGFDHVLSYVYPYHFWYTRTYSKMMLRMTRSPGYLATWARYRNFVQNEHAGLPEWWKNNISSDMFGISPQNPFYFNLESSINPLNGLTGIDFNDPNRRITAVSRTLDDLGKFGPTPWLPYQLFMGIGSALWGPKEQARAWLGNRLLPQSQLIKSATHLMGISAPSSAKLPFLGPGGLEIDPFVLLFEQGKGTPFEQNRIGRALGDLEQEQKITHEQALEAARLKEGTVWDMAIERAASERDWSNVIAGLTSAGLKARSQSEMMIDIAYTTAAMLRASKANMSPEQYSAKWAKFYADYPWMEAVMIGRAVGIDADEAYAWNVFSRIPPGQSREWAEAAKIDPEMLQRFYDTKGDLTKFNELDRKDFMVAIEKLGATLSTPADSTRGEWELARSQYKAFFGAPPDIRKKEIYYNNLPGAQEREEYLAENPDLEKWFNLEIGVDTFYREQGKDPKLGAKFLEDNPDVAQYLAYREQTILADPILFKYYGGIDFVEKSWRRGMYAEAEKLFGEDIFDIQTAYFEVKENGWDLRSFKAQHPQLLEYWDWLHARKAELELRLAEIDDLMPETVKASIRPDAPEDSLSIQAILEGLKETAPAIDTPSDLALQYMTKPEEEGGDFSITAYLDTEAEKMWPGVLADLQEWQRLNAENPFAAKTFRASHPDLVEYQRWEKAERKKYNALNAGKPARLNAVTVSWSEWQQAIDPEGDGIVPRLIIDHFRGKALSADLKKRLEGLWIVMGRPMGSFEKWLSTMKSAWAVTPTY